VEAHVAIVLVEGGWDSCLIATKHVLRYLRGTVGYGLRYAFSVDLSLQGYADADWGGSTVDRKSTSGCCFTLGSTMVYLCSRKQSFVALSTAEAEYIALSVAVREAVWLRKLLTDLFDCEMDPTIVHCDNQSYVKLSENPVFHDRSKPVLPERGSEAGAGSGSVGAHFSKNGWERSVSGVFLYIYIKKKTCRMPN
jgi:hypothetical protein